MRAAVAVLIGTFIAAAFDSRSRAVLAAVVVPDAIN
jgi:hypothetical protein